MWGRLDTTPPPELIDGDTGRVEGAGLGFRSRRSSDSECAFDPDFSAGMESEDNAGCSYA